MWKYGYLTEKLLKKRVAPYYTESKKKHIQDVLRYARLIKGERLSPLELAIIYYHDIEKKRVGNNGHEEAGARFAEKDLKRKYSEEDIRLVAQAIRLHSPDYRLSKLNFKHDSREAELLALADDVNLKFRDPDLMAQTSVKFIKQHPEIFLNSSLKGYQRHVDFFGPAHAHKNLQFYKDLWDHIMERPMKEVDKYSKRKWKKYWDTIDANTLIPDIDSIYYNP